MVVRPKRIGNIIIPMLFAFSLLVLPLFVCFFIVDSFLSQVAAVSVDVSAASLYYETNHYNVML